MAHGAILGMDRFGLDVFNPTAQRVAAIAALCSQGYADRIVLSHDADCLIDYFPGEAANSSPPAAAEVELPAHQRRRAARAAGAGVDDKQISRCSWTTRGVTSTRTVHDMADRDDGAAVRHRPASGATRTASRTTPACRGSLVEMLRTARGAAPGRGGRSSRSAAARLTYRQLWDAAARVAGGLRRAGRRPRRPSGEPAARRGRTGCSAFFGAQLAGAVACR